MLTTIASAVLSINMLFSVSSNQSNQSDNHYRAMQGTYSNNIVTTIDGEQWRIKDDSLINGSQYIVVFETEDTDTIYDDEITAMVSINQ